MKKLFKDYGLSIVLATLFLTSWAGQLYFQWHEYRDQQEAHNQPVVASEFVLGFFAATFENWQSEFLQLLTFVVLTGYLIHKGSHESKDSSEKMQQSIDRVERKLGELSRHK